MNFKKLRKLQTGDKVALLSPSFAAPSIWPEVYDLGKQRLQELELIPVEFPTTSKLNASDEERSNDLIAAFEDNSIRAVIATLGGNDQVTYIKNLPSKPFVNNPKPFFGFSDNTHFSNFLWLNGMASYYGASLFTQFASPGKIDEFTLKYLKLALFQNAMVEIQSSPVHSEYSNTDWNNLQTLQQERQFISNTGWKWDGSINANGFGWGGCLESIDEILRHGLVLPSLEDFKEIVIILETSEEKPSPEYVHRVIRALGERGYLTLIQGILVGRPDTGYMDASITHEEREEYRKNQTSTITECVRNYNPTCPIVQNLDIGHTHPQIPIPLGKEIIIDSTKKSIKVEF